MSKILHEYVFDMQILKSMNLGGGGGVEKQYLQLNIMG